MIKVKNPIVLYPDPVLTTPCKLVTEFDENLESLVDSMFEAMYRDHGIGLAANQIGVDARVAVIDLQDGDTSRIILVNPKLLYASRNKHTTSEGCLSVPEIREDKARSVTVDVEAQDLNGNVFFTRGTWLLARALQHEINHLDGVLCLSEDALRRFAHEQAKVKHG